MKLLALLLATVAWGALACAADDAPRIVYSKSFPGSNPPYIQITIAKTGDGVYQEDKNDDDPLKFHLTGSEAGEMFDLADRLGHFTHPLESGLKVANMGRKTLRWEDGGEPHEETFNYSEIPEAKEIYDLFEKIAESERARIALENAVRFDKLGVQDAILQIEVLRDQKRLVAPEQFLPMLDRIVKDERFLKMARDRAAPLADSIRNAK